MNCLKKVFAIVLVATMALSFCGCHKKGEVAVKIGDVEFTSAYYMCALIDADMNARQEVDNNAEEDADTSAEDYYYKQKIDGKKFVTYVKEQALDKLKELAAYISKAKEAKVEVTEDDQSTIDAYVSYYWTSAGYSTLYEPNGVSKETFKQYFHDSYYASAYFDSIYGKDGTKAISDDDIKAFRTENYALVETITSDLSSMEDAEKTTTTEQFNSYYDALKSGSATFNTIYESFNSVEEANKQDSYATVVGSDKTDNADSNFATIKAMATGEIKLITAEDGSSVTLVVKKDLEADETNVNNLDSTIRHALKDEEFDSEIDDYKKSLKVNEIKFATKQFDVKKIEYPESAS